MHSLNRRAYEFICKSEGCYESSFLTILFTDPDVPEAIFQVDEAIVVIAGRSLNLIHNVRQQMTIFLRPFIKLTIISANPPNRLLINNKFHVCTGGFLRRE
jgi:hypothetical protein